MRSLRNFVDGKFTDTADGAVSDIVDPSTGQPYAQAPVSDAADVDAALLVAARAFETWRDTTPAERSLALLKFADAVKYGLAASVWTRDHGRAMRVSRALDFGAVWINTHIPFVSEMPHGGFKHSGYGKDLSLYGFDDYTRIKHVMSYIGE